MATRGYLPGTLTVVDVPNKEEPEILMFACNKGYLIPMNEEELEAMMGHVKEEPQYVQWYEYWVDDYEEAHA